MDEANDGRKGIIRPRINGQYMAKYVGKPVCIIGTAQDVEPRGTAFKLKTCDNVVISVRLTEPLDGYLSGIVECFGTVTSRNTLLCESVIDFPPEYTEKMDLSQYNEAITLLHESKHYDKLTTDVN